MQDRTRGFLFLLGGGLLLVLSLDTIIKILIIFIGLWMLDKGMRLHHQRPLQDVIKDIILK